MADNTGKLTHSLIARKPFAQVEDLKGATIGILNMTEGTFFQIKEMLAAHGLHYPQDYSVKETGGVPHRHKALLDGSIDAGLQSIPWNYVGEDAGLNKLGDIIDYVPDWQFVTINANALGPGQSRRCRFILARDRAGYRMVLFKPGSGRANRRSRVARPPRTTPDAPGTIIQAQTP